MEQSIEDHLDRIQERLNHGRQILSTMREPDIKAYDVPDVMVDRSILHLNIPLKQDKCVDTLLLPLSHYRTEVSEL
jgi:hypothetical protein